NCKAFRSDAREQPNYCKSLGFRRFNQSHSNRERLKVDTRLLSAGVEESSTDELVSQIIESLEELAAESEGNASPEQIRSALTSVLEENGVNTDAFEQSLVGDLDDGGFVIDEYV
ncbi:MAG: hypothetical protein ABJK10_02040, partial [Rhodopirellula bahusiensis]